MRWEQVERDDELGTVFDLNLFKRLGLGRSGDGFELGEADGGWVGRWAAGRRARGCGQVQHAGCWAASCWSLVAHWAQGTVGGLAVAWGGKEGEDGPVGAQKTNWWQLRRYT